MALPTIHIDISGTAVAFYAVGEFGGIRGQGIRGQNSGTGTEFGDRRDVH